MAVFLEVIEWFDETGRTMMHRIPQKGSAEIKLGAQLVVRENQAAIFFRDGKAYDILGPGRHTLSTLNLPLVTKVLSLPFGAKSPFRVEIYFANTKFVVVGCSASGRTDRGHRPDRQEKTSDCQVPACFCTS